jgi:hypothetical protein
MAVDRMNWVRHLPAGTRVVISQLPFGEQSSEEGHLLLHCFVPTACRMTIILSFNVFALRCSLSVGAVLQQVA